MRKKEEQRTCQGNHRAEVKLGSLLSICSFICMLFIEVSFINRSAFQFNSFIKLKGVGNIDTRKGIVWRKPCFVY